MIGVSRDFQHLQLEISTQRCEEVVALCRGSHSGRLVQGGILRERLVIGFHVPSFAIDCGDLVVSEVEIAGDQIQDTHTFVKTCLARWSGKFTPSW